MIKKLLKNIFNREYHHKPNYKQLFRSTFADRDTSVEDLKKKLETVEYLIDKNDDDFMNGKLKWRDLQTRNILLFSQEDRLKKLIERKIRLCP